jgi:hypothetical protein
MSLIRQRRVFALAAVVFAIACSAPSGLSPSRGPRTRAERTRYTETSHYTDVIAFLDSLHGRPELSFGSIGRTTEGRGIPFVIASRPRVSTPDQARRLGRPIVYVQGNIHAGEVEGKEALLALVRDLTSSSAPNVLDSLVLIAVPIYNADGNEKFAPQEVNRGSQNGPEMVGQRANGQGLDLNRDYVKAEAPETRASLGMFNKWDPDVFVDLHTTDGSYHGYALTYSPPLAPAAPLGTFARDSMMPLLRQRMQSRHNFATFDYGDFISDDTLSKGWVTFDARPRFGTNYYGLRGRIAILSEAYSHDPFERRVASTYAFVKEILSLVAERSAVIRTLERRPRLNRIPVRSELIAAPESAAVVAEVVERTGDSALTQAGVPKGRRRTGRFITVRMPVFERFNPLLTIVPPQQYTIPAADSQVVKALQEHGVVVTQRTKPERRNVEVFVIDSVIPSQRLFQGHLEMRLAGHWHGELRVIASGTFVVRTDQVLGPLAAYLLEPQSDDGLVTWNFFDSELKAGANFPVIRVSGVMPIR